MITWSDPCWGWSGVTVNLIARKYLLSRRVYFLGYPIAEHKYVVVVVSKDENKGAEDGEIVDLHIAVHVHIPSIPQQQGVTD